MIVCGVGSLVVLDDDAVRAVLPLEEPVPGHPDRGEGYLEYSCE